jgi:hypothetical protein
VDQEDVREMQQPWWKRNKEEVDSSSCKLGHGDWPYDPEIEQLMEECVIAIFASPYAILQRGPYSIPPCRLTFLD